jgi:DNA-directed RNA polymerase subunit H (RpoH/RPB5)
LIEQLDKNGYDVSEYKEFSINEIDAMLTNNCLDILVNNPDNTKKTYVTWLLSGKVKHTNVENIARDLFEIEGTLTKKDTLVIVSNEPANKTIEAKIKYLYDHDGIFIVYYYLRQLQFNVLTHSLVPECSVMKDSEVEEFKKKYNVKHLAQLPEISRFDPMAQALHLRPGQVCKIIRPSPTAITNNYYRICV